MCIRDSTGCGLNNAGQLHKDMQGSKMLELVQLCGKDLLEIVGGSFHAMALDVTGNVFTWGRSDYCGRNKSEGVMEIGRVELPAKAVKIASGSSHCIVAVETGDVFTWGFGEMNQLGNQPRDFMKPTEIAEGECCDELKPYCLSSKQLNERFVFAVGAGAQHSVEIGWNGKYADEEVVKGKGEAKKRKGVEDKEDDEGRLHKKRKYNSIY